MATLHAVKGHGVTINVTGKWEDAFTELQALGRRIGFSTASIHSYKDQRTNEQRFPAGKKG